MNNSNQIENKPSINRTLKRWPYYVLLLPVFFVLHGVRENFGIILFSDYFPLLLFYCVSAGLIFGLIYLIYRQKNKAGIITFLILSVFFFYGSLQDFLKEHLASVSRYKILIPFFFLTLIIIAIVLKKTKSNFTRLNFFLNWLLILYSVYDLSAILIKTISPPADKFFINSFGRNGQYNICNDCPKPDIYFLVFDEYASSLCLKNDLGYDNSQLDSFFISKQFRIQKNSSANYNLTPFSVSSILNMSYINGINPESITSEDYARCNKLIRENELIKYLSSGGYSIINYSLFDIAHNPSPVSQNFLPLKARLITDRTLWGRIEKDILWNFLFGKFEIKWLTKGGEYFYEKNNNKLINLLKKESERKTNHPRFIYAHFNMPHQPYYFDKNGKHNEKEKLMRSPGSDKSLYLGYVGYTNTKIRELVNSILKNANGEAVITIMGDHGFRDDKKMPQHVFLQNQNAVYLPHKNYNLFYDSISGVNQFRVLINTLFKQNVPMLKDSTVFLKDAE